MAGFSIPYETDWSAHDRMARFIGEEAIPRMHILRTRAYRLNTIESVDAWFNEIDSIYSICKPIIATEFTRAMDKLYFHYEKVKSVCLIKKPKHELFCILQKITDLYMKFLIEGLQKVQYLFKIKPARRSKVEAMEEFARMVAGEEDV